MAPGGHRAVRWHAASDVRVDVVAAPDTSRLAEGEVVVAVEACGVCGTDVAIALGAGDEVPLEPHVTTGCHAPLTQGHEIVGRVVAGDGDILGSRVVVWPYVTCQRCNGPRGTAAGACHRCPLAGHLGINAHGGMADLVVVRSECCVVIPESVPLDAAVLCEPMAVVLKAFRATAPVEGTRVAIVGGGSIGLCALDVAWFRGAAEVLVVDPHAGVRAAALEAGATGAIRPDDVDTIAADVVLEASGAASGLNTALRACRPGGTVLAVGDTGSPDPLDLETLLMREITIIGSVGHDFAEDFVTAADAIVRGALGARPRPVVHVGLDETPDILLGASTLRAGAKVVIVTAQPTPTPEA